MFGHCAEVEFLQNVVRFQHELGAFLDQPVRAPAGTIEDVARHSEHVEAQAALPDNETERVLLARLSHEPVLADELVRELQLPTEVVTATLAMMELKGMVRQASGTSFVLAREERLPYRVD